MIPNEYLAYYYGTADVVARQLAAGRTRGAGDRRDAGGLLRAGARHAEAALQAWRETTRARSSTYMAEAGAVRADGSRAGAGVDDLEGYAGVALRAALALRSGEPTVMVLNARNRSALPFLPADAIVETVCVVTGAGVRTVATAPAAAARPRADRADEGGRADDDRGRPAGLGELAARALALHPLVPSVAVADRILDAYRAQEPNLRALLA